VGTNPIAVAVNPSTNQIYVANYGSGTVSVINGATNTVIATVTVGNEPDAVALNPSTN
jgi:YVTN family beta-propeller protein